MMDRLPKDLWVQIFLRLLVKTILRCRSVCKSWQLFVKHRSFIKSHLRHQRRDLILVRSIPMDNKNQFHYIDLGDDDTSLAVEKKPDCYSLYFDDESFTFHAKHEFPVHHPSGGHYRVVGICNGILCITNDRFGISHQTYLWNPTIRKCVELPKPAFTFNNFGGFDHELGFGFDEKTNDYKVVRIVEKNYWNDDPIEVEIYSLNSGIWRKASRLASDLGVRIYKRYRTGRNYQVYLNGAVHWVGERREESLCVVIAFHLGDEVFCCFETPLEIKNRDFCWKRSLRPLEFRGSLSMIHYGETKCSIWMMKNYGDSSSWAKHLDVDLSNRVDQVIGLRKNGELLIEIQGGLYSYKPTEGKELIYLNERELWQWKLLQEGHTEGLNIVSQRVYDYDPEFAPKELGIKSETKGSFTYSLYSESYTESLVLI